MKPQIKNYWPLAIPIAVISLSLYFLISPSAEKRDQWVGMVEADYVQMASEIPGRLQVRYFSEGDRVKKGQVLAKMSPKEVEALTGQSQAAVDAAQAQLDMLKNGARKEEVDAAKNLYLISVDQFDLAEKTYRRMKSLYEDSVIAGEEYDLADFKYKAARKEMLATKAKYDALKNGARPEAIQAAEALVEQAKDAHSFTSTLGSNLDIVAPCDGIVSSVGIEEGEVIMTGYPLASIQKDSTLHVILQVRQDEMQSFELGNTLTGEIPGTTNSERSFVVTHRKALLDYADWVPTNQKGSFELKTFEVHLECEDPSQLIPGMTVIFQKPE